MMQLFNATVRLGGSLNNEVDKYGLTVPEILILRKIHGADGVVKLKNVGETFIDDDDERVRLHELYAEGLEALHEDMKTSVEKMFGTYGNLPDEMKGYDGAIVEHEFEDLEDAQVAPAYTSPNFADKKTARKAERDKRKAAAAKAGGKKAPKKAGTIDAALS